MPTYEYNCPACGDFTAVRPMAEYRNDQPCPKCATASSRITRTVPGLTGMFTGIKDGNGTRTLQSCAHPGGCRCC